MKKYVRAASRTLPFPTVGSGQGGDRRNGKIGFGRGYTITMDNGGTFQLGSAIVVFDTNTGELATSVSVSIELRLDQEYKHERDTYGTSKFHQYFQNYTPDECTKLYDVVSGMTTEELYDFLAPYEERMRATNRKGNLEFAKHWLSTHPDDELEQRQIDKYEGKIDDEGYWLE